MTSRRTRRRLIGALLGLAVLGWVGLMAVDLYRADHQLQAGVAEMTRVRHEVSTQDLADNRPARDLAVAQAAFASAHGDIHNPFTAPLRILPWVGRQIRSLDALSGAAATVVDAGAHTLAQAHALLRAPHQTGAQRAEVIRQLARVVSTLNRRLAGVSLGPSNALFPPLAKKRATFATELGKLRTGLSRATGATTALSDLLVGPRTYLILACNNAEMRAGSGMPLEVGTLQSDNGRLTLGRFIPSSQLALSTPQVPLRGSLAARWGFLRPNEDWRNLNLTPQFNQTAQLAASMWRAQMGQQVDGVIAVDVAFVKDILAVTGPVSSSGFSVDAANVEHELLIGQYAGLPAQDPTYAARQEKLGALAAATFAAIQKPGVSLPGLAGALSRAVTGRHALLWAATPRIEADWQAAGAAGIVGPQDMLLSLMNAGANKLDPYQHVTADLKVSPGRSDTTVTVTVTDANHAPGGAPSYAGGGQFFPPGVYAADVALDFPHAAGRVRVVGRPKLVAAGPDGPAQVVAVPLQVLPGRSATVTFSFQLAGSHGALRVDPSARIPATRWIVAGRVFRDSTARIVSW